MASIRLHCSIHYTFLRLFSPTVYTKPCFILNVLGNSRLCHCYDWSQKIMVHVFLSTCLSVMVSLVGIFCLFTLYMFQLLFMFSAFGPEPSPASVRPIFRVYMTACKTKQPSARHFKFLFLSLRRKFIWPLKSKLFLSCPNSFLLKRRRVKP